MKDEKEKKRNTMLNHLTSPIKVGPLELKNRIVLAPANTLMSNDVYVSQQEAAYFGARAKGGAGWVSTGAICATRLAAQFPAWRNSCLYHTGHIQGMTMLTDHIHYFGSLAVAQMIISCGRQGHSYDHSLLAPAPTAGLPYEAAAEKMLGGTPVSKMKDNESIKAVMGMGQMTREVGTAELQHLQKEYAESCQLAVCAGFDAIEIHACHGYFVHEFLSPFSNKRSDMYGGEWRNRKRLVNELMEQVRYACPGVAVGVRMSGEEHMEGGLTSDEMVDLAQDLEARGADYISLSDGGGYEENGHLIPDGDRAEHMPETSSKFKKALKIPVIVMSQHDPVKADADIGAGKYDISALARQLFADPEYPNKVMEGRLDEIVRCKRDNGCLLRLMCGMPCACILNPSMGREYVMDEYKIGPRRKHEVFYPKGLTREPIPALNRPWWKKEVPLLEKCWRLFRGPGPR